MNDTVVRNSRNIEVSLQSPWVIHGKKIYRLFEKDPSVTVDLGNCNLDGGYTIYIDCTDKDKLISIYKVMNNFIEMGNVNLTIEYNGIDMTDDAVATVEDWDRAFSGNAYFVNMIQAGPWYTYAVFKREIVSIYTDDMLDYCCNSHYIVADIVRDVTLLNGAVSPCTSAV